MTNILFIDTNILVYAYTNEKDGKTDKAIKFLESISLFESYISIQVINEFCNALIYNKVPSSIINRYIIEINDSYNVLPINFNISKNGLLLKEKYKYKWYDSLLLATTLENNCNTFYSEDLQHNQIIENRLKIVNPLR